MTHSDQSSHSASSPEPATTFFAKEPSAASGDENGIMEREEDLAPSPYTKVAPQDEPDDFDELYGYSDDVTQQVKQILSKRGSVKELETVLADLHAADIADIIQHLASDERRQFVMTMGEELDSEILTHLDYAVRLSLTEALPLAKLAAFLGDLESDDAVDIIEDLSEEEQQRLLSLVPAADRAIYEQALAFPEDSAGRLMRREVVTVPNFWTIGQTIDYLRSRSLQLPDEFYSIIVVGPNHKPVGQARVSRLLRTARVVAIANIMDREPKLIPADMDQEDAAFLFRQYGLVEAPVIDRDGRLVGAITIDDIIEVIQEEHEEDILKLAGVSSDDFYSGFIATARSRLTWLFVNLMTALLASSVIGMFSQQLEQLVALAVLMPIVASMGGNAGTQTLTVVVRALATNELTRGNMMSTLGKEILVGFSNGLVFALLISVTAGLWFHNLWLGVIIGLAMLINLTAAGLAGVCIPIAMEKLNIDPAIASAVFLTTVTDIVGFLSFLGLASWLILGQGL